MEQETQQPETTQVETEPTLDDVYRDAGISEVIPQTTAQPQPQVAQPTQPQEPRIPEPYDTDAYKNYMAQKEKESAEIRQSLSQIQNIVVREQMQRAQAKLQADIGKAVETVNAEVNHPKPKVIEAILDAKAREDYRFKQLFDNRDKNPAAWEKALKVVAKEIKNDFSLKVDPNLQESQRQRKLAQSAMATTAAPEKDDEWSNLTQEEFDAKWQRMASGG